MLGRRFDGVPAQTQRPCSEGRAGEEHVGFGVAQGDADLIPLVIESVAGEPFCEIAVQHLFKRTDEVVDVEPELAVDRVEDVSVPVGVWLDSGSGRIEHPGQGRILYA